ncbi:MAG: ribose 5-phosphate isomerase B [Clostridia bacterium]|nr:ribose 5-phosphate isomerase B [Clostridia bacterium]
MKIAICSDHGGFELKMRLIPFIEALGHEVSDLGCYSEASVDYPDMAFPAAEAVARGEYERGIAICGTGIGVSICCNKVRGIRCALCGDVLSAELTRRHNDSNMLAMGGRIIGAETAKAIVKTWLGTDFEGGRHENRIAKITAYEAEK